MEPSFDAVTDVCERIGFARRLILADIGAMSDEMLRTSCGGVSRCGFDLLFELSGMYRSFAGLLNAGSGEISGPQQGWVTAPDAFKESATSVGMLNDAFDAFVDALRCYAGDPTKDEFRSPVGLFTPLAMGNLAVWHTMYHSGQLNYIQTIHGDSQFHWA